MAPDNAIEAERCGVERDQAEIARQTDQAPADRIGQRAPDIKRFGNRDHDRRRQQGKAADEDEAEAEHDVQRAGIDRAGTEIAEFRKQHRADHNHSRHQACGEKSEQNHEQAADQCHIAKSISTNTSTNLSTIMPGHSSLLLRRLRKLVCGAGHPRLASSSLLKTWMGGASTAMTTLTYSSHQSVIAMARSACRSRTDSFSVSDLSWPQAARMSRPRGVRTGEE